MIQSDNCLGMNTESKIHLNDMTSELNLLEVSNIVITTTTLLNTRHGENIAALQANITHW